MAEQRTGSNGKDDKANLNAGEKHAQVIEWKLYAENPPNLESASGKCMYNKELSDVPSIPFASETNFAEIEVHPRVRRRRHSDTEVSIDKILSLA
ncbi:hypothetical protein SCA6_003870 [Theobroma cacao]